MTADRDAPGRSQLAGLVFELASQLHVERARRMALESALAAAGLLQPGALESLAADPVFRQRARAALESSIEKLMQVLAEGQDPRTPLRPLSAPPEREGV